MFTAQTSFFSRRVQADKRTVTDASDKPYARGGSRSTRRRANSPTQSQLVADIMMRGPRTLNILQESRRSRMEDGELG